jgi:acetyl-CoA synthetase
MFMNESHFPDGGGGALVADAQLPEIRTADVESALASHPQVAEVVVVPVAFRLGRQVFSAFVTLKLGTTETDALRAELVQRVREGLDDQAVPEKFHFASHLPKTRSGKIMRDILQEMAET